MQSNLHRRSSELSETSEAVRKKCPANLFSKEELGHEQANHIPTAQFRHDFAMFATAAPVSAEPATSTFTFTVEADKTTAGPGDTVTFTVYIQQTGTMTCFAGKLGIPSGLTYVVDSGALTEGIQEKLGRDEVAWTQDPYKLLSAFGAEDFTGTDKIAVMTFQCTVDNDTAAGNYEVTLLELEADGGSTENYETKIPHASLRPSLSLPHRSRQRVSLLTRAN